MHLTEHQKKIALGAGALLAVMAIALVFFLTRGETQTRIDTSEVECSKHTIESVEFNTDTNSCFTAKISACQAPTYKDMESCQKANPKQ